MFNHCFELHLYWSVKSLPEDLVCQRDLLHHVFPERWRERKSLSPETPFYIFAPFIRTDEDVSSSYHRTGRSSSASLSLHPRWSLKRNTNRLRIWEIGSVWKVLLVGLLCVSPTSGPGGPIPPGVPDLPWKTQRDGCDADLKCAAQTMNRNDNHHLWGSLYQTTDSYLGSDCSRFTSWPKKTNMSLLEINTGQFFMFLTRLYNNT